MSTFAVTIERIASIWPHSNADRLELARLASMTFQFAVAKGIYQSGDQVVYFPLDSLLPQDLIDRLGLDGKLSGKQKNRIKTVRLRGEISQGVVAPIAEVLPAGQYVEGQDVTTVLGVEKYEPPAVVDTNGRLTALPATVGVYDIEGADRFPDVAEALMDVPAIITEKLEGSHFAATLEADGTFSVSQRRHRIEPVPGAEHTWWKVARQMDLRAKCEALMAAYPGAQVVTLRGEMVGPRIQGNIYGLADHRVYLFEAEINGQAISAPEFAALIVQMEWADQAVPHLLRAETTLREWLAGRSVAKASNGASQINPSVAREGIVIRPAAEGWHDRIGRLIIKQRSPEYLAGADT